MNTTRSPCAPCAGSSAPRRCGPAASTSGGAIATVDDVADQKTGARTPHASGSRACVRLATGRAQVQVGDPHTAVAARALLGGIVVDAGTGRSRCAVPRVQESGVSLHGAPWSARHVTLPRPRREASVTDQRLHAPSGRPLIGMSTCWQPISRHAPADPVRLCPVRTRHQALRGLKLPPPRAAAGAPGRHRAAGQRRIQPLDATRARPRARTRLGGRRRCPALGRAHRRHRWVEVGTQAWGQLTRFTGTWVPIR